MATTALLISFVVGVVVPLAVAALTNNKATSGLKAVLATALSCVGGALTGVAVDGLDWKKIAAAAIASFVASGVAYTHVWKPTGAIASVASATSGMGVGGDVATPRRRPIRVRQ